MLPHAPAVSVLLTAGPAAAIEIVTRLPGARFAMAAVIPRQRKCLPRP
jgi:hypothetical protein